MYGYETATELTEVPGTGARNLHNIQKFRVRGESFIELTEVPGVVAQACRTRRSCGQVYKCCTYTPGYCGPSVQSLQLFRVRVWMSYITYTTHCAIHGVNTPGVVLDLPYRTQPCNK